MPVLALVGWILALPFIAVLLIVVLIRALWPR